MTCYAFVSEPVPPRNVLPKVYPPASERAAAEPACPDDELTTFEQVVLRVLERFPEAYRAVMEELRRMEVGDGGP